mmetsp:Transcript_11993/g.40564  ORF Transcript_11993/g.40564 Transcript_11993/m.40564 type:complete len:241 (-) Transcript_11993:111-833(-)
MAAPMATEMLGAPLRSLPLLSLPPPPRSPLPPPKLPSLPERRRRRECESGPMVFEGRSLDASPLAPRSTGLVGASRDGDDVSSALPLCRTRVTLSRRSRQPLRNVRSARRSLSACLAARSASRPTIAGGPPSAPGWRKADAAAAAPTFTCGMTEPCTTRISTFLSTEESGFSRSPFMLSSRSAMSSMTTSTGVRTFTSLRTTGCLVTTAGKGMLTCSSVVRLYCSRRPPCEPPEGVNGTE